jgi:hypothetical protein
MAVYLKGFSSQRFASQPCRSTLFPLLSQNRFPFNHSLHPNHRVCNGYGSRPLRTCRMWFVFRQSWESPEHRQDETIQRNGGHLLLMLFGLYSTSTLFTCGVYIADKYELLRLILYCSLIALFRTWMIFECIKFVRIIQGNTPLPYSPQTRKELYEMKICSWIEAVFVLLIPVAYILTPYYINLWNLDLIHPGMLMVLFSVHASFHNG